MRSTKRFANRALDWLLSPKWPIWGFVYKLAFNINFIMNFWTSQRICEFPNEIRNIWVGGCLKSTVTMWAAQHFSRQFRPVGSIIYLEWELASEKWSPRWRKLKSYKTSILVLCQSLILKAKWLKFSLQIYDSTHRLRPVQVKPTSCNIVGPTTLHDVGRKF